MKWHCAWFVAIKSFWKTFAKLQVGKNVNNFLKENNTNFIWNTFFKSINFIFDIFGFSFYCFVGVSVWSVVVDAIPFSTRFPLFRLLWFFHWGEGVGLFGRGLFIFWLVWFGQWFACNELSWHVYETERIELKSPIFIFQQSFFYTHSLTHSLSHTHTHTHSQTHFFTHTKTHIYTHTRGSHSILIRLKNGEKIFFCGKPNLD